ncbi:MAG: NAD(P)H-dependent oxidoreductase [Treponema sp.]|nr:NAD(P)H-dependent oxidoreductase [Treponema sp.]
MKTAVVYYSYDGNCAFAAKQIQSRFNADIVQIEVLNEKRRSGFAKYFFGGFQAFSGIKPALKPYSFDPAAYDLIILGTPVWAGSPAPAMKSFLSKTKISGKKICLFMCHAGGLGNAIEKFKILLAGNDIVSAIDLNNPAENNQAEQKQRIEDWCKAIQ